MRDKVQKVIKNIQQLVATPKRPVVLGLVATLLLIVGAGLWMILRETEPDVSNNDQSTQENLSGPELERLGDYAGAAVSYGEEAETADEEEVKPNLYELAGDAYNKAGQYDDAIEAYKKAYEAYKNTGDEHAARRAESKILLNENDKLATEGEELDE